ncbi:MAG TPA: ABC transporter ATP-binding protein, partial [Burkholderiaceae bacterium]|nr:ABC transporter ATP-binding protein [Burkholderiaceae bacterium]
PEILLLDEPFSALDQVTRSDMQALLKQIIRRHKTAAVFVTHDINEALILADRILLIGDYPGRLIGQWHLDVHDGQHPGSDAFSNVRAEIIQLLGRFRQHAS